MLQEPGQLVVCNNHSGVCRWQCLSWCSPRLASLRLVFQCFHKPKRVSIHLFYFFPREASDPEDTCLAVGPAPEWCRSPLGSPTRFARRRSAISLATRSNHSTEPHSPRGLHFAIYRQSSLDENFQRALVRPLQAKKKKKLTGPAGGPGLVPRLKALPFARCSTLAVKHVHSDA